MRRKQILLDEEFGRSWQSHDQVGNISWEDYEEVDVEITGDTAQNKWLVSVKCPKYPNESLPTRAFSDEASANAYARSESERIHNKLLNIRESILRESIRRYILKYSY